MRKYYGLITLDEGQFTWSFGSYERSDVTYERQDMRDHGYKLQNMRIMTFDRCPTSGEVDRLIAQLNSVVQA